MKPHRPIGSLIVTVRQTRVLLAADLAAIYGVQTRALNQAVKRNADRFPSDFVFQLTAEEFAALRSQNVILDDGRAAFGARKTAAKRGRHAKYAPYAFTEHGAIMAASVLSSPQAVAMSVFVVRAFIAMREQLAANAAILKRLAEIDKTLLEHDQSLRVIWQQLKPLLSSRLRIRPADGLGFNVVTVDFRCTKDPLDLLRDASVDMERPEPVETALTHFGKLVDELDELI